MSPRPRPPLPAAARSPVAVAAAVVAAAASGVLVAGCGVQPTGIVSAGAGPVASGYAADVTVYLVRGGRLHRVTRPGRPGHPYLAIEQLSVPPTTQDRRRGLATEIRRPLSAQAGDGPGQLVVAEYGGPYLTRWTRLAKAQVACTAEAIPGVSFVTLATWEDSLNRRVPCAGYQDLLA